MLLANFFISLFKKDITTKSYLMKASITEESKLDVFHFDVHLMATERAVDKSEGRALDIRILNCTEA